MIFTRMPTANNYRIPVRLVANRALEKPLHSRAFLHLQKYLFETQSETSKARNSQNRAVFCPYLTIKKTSSFLLASVEWP